ncbi:MAG: hypothetical protein J1F40_08765 [Prevotellaceae bacterium]|nr:hypothetical protein [Prevotellaceae bacterium]
MKIKNHLLVGATLLAPLALQSCFDNDYDLSDIDTTVRINTKDLVVPINIDVLTLDQVIELDDDSEIVIDTIPGTEERIYAIKKEGDFTSENITIKDFCIKEPTIDPTTAPLALTSASLPSGVDGAYIILDGVIPPTTFTTTTGDIDQSIRTITGLKVDTKYATTLRVSGMDAFLGNAKMERLILKYPEGMRGRYVKDGKTFSLDSDGYLDLSSIEFGFDSKGEINIVVDIDSIDASRGNMQFDTDNHSLEFDDDIQIVQGDINLRKVSNVSSLPQSITFTMAPRLYDIPVHNFSGEFEHNVEQFSINPVDLNSIPDFLNQPGTKIRIENPQIYLSISNPLNEYNIRYESGFQLTAKDGKKSSVYLPEKEKEGQKSINITSTGKDEQGYNEIVMSPTIPAYYCKGYTSPEHIAFTDLQNVLADDNINEIPETIEIDIIEPRMPMQQVNNIELGKDFGTVNGLYTFYAPLGLLEESLISYTDTINGWNDEDVDALTLSNVAFSFDATTDLPYEVSLKIVPITFDDKDIEGVTSKDVTLKEYAKDQPVTLSMEGTIKHLDGIKIVARIISKDVDTMGPDMKIHIKNSKITLTGYYEKEL